MCSNGLFCHNTIIVPTYLYVRRLFIIKPGSVQFLLTTHSAVLDSDVIKSKALALRTIEARSVVRVRLQLLIFQAYQTTKTDISLNDGLLSSLTDIYARMLAAVPLMFTERLDILRLLG